VRVYLDNNATTPIDPRVGEAMAPWLSVKFGNAFSRDHSWGWDAAEAIEDAHVAVSRLLGAPGHHVIFSSGATEGLSTVIRGYLEFPSHRPKTVVVGATEHPAVLSCATYFCDRAGASLVIVPVDRAGSIDLDRLRECLRAAPVALVAVMAANNEIGTVPPIHAIGAVVREARSLFLCDTTQAVGKLTLDLEAANIDFATVSAHKFHGPQGVGALLVSKPAVEQFAQPGGGTPNVPGIVGLGAACRIAGETLESEAARLGELRDRLESAIAAEVDGTWINGDRSRRLSNTSSMGFEGIEGRVLIRDIHEVALSTRAACATGSRGPSHVLKAIGLSDSAAYATVRFSLGRFTTREEIDFTVRKVCESVKKLRQLKLSGA
jgi:cysteine desulfurase